MPRGKSKALFPHLYADSRTEDEDEDVAVRDVKTAKSVKAPKKRKKGGRPKNPLVISDGVKLLQDAIREIKINSRNGTYLGTFKFHEDGVAFAEPHQRQGKMVFVPWAEFGLRMRHEQDVVAARKK
jgi:hypothetical protein